MLASVAFYIAWKAAYASLVVVVFSSQLHDNPAWCRSISKAEKRGGVWKVPTKKTVLCSILFNTMGYLHELLKAELEKEKAA